ncbi:MAG: acyltransferase [Cycloclasticus sp.]|nr:acyltransferase [Cycloclasticus sp.]
MQKLVGLEGLRGLMSLWVVLSHAVTIAALPVYKAHGVGLLLANGGFAVDVFIILSGFVIALLITERREQFSVYLCRRAFRLFPVYLVAFVLSILAFDISVQFLNSLPWDHPKTAVRLSIFEESMEMFSYHIPAHLLLLHGMIPESVLPATNYAFMGQAWSLSLEWQFYLVAPFLVALMFKYSNLRLLVLCGVFAISEPAFRIIFGHWNFIFASSFLFLFGIFSYKLYRGFREGSVSEKEYVSIFLFVCGVVIVDKAVLRGWLYAIPVLIWMATLFSETLTAGRFKIVKKINNSRVALFLGRVSYSIYCIHMVVMYVWGYFLVVVIGVESHYVYAFSVLILSFATTLIASKYLYNFVEAPFIKLAKRAFK